LTHGASSPDVVRGEHAHRICHQLLVAATGSLIATCDDGNTKSEFLLDKPTLGLYMPPLTWGTQTNFSEGARLLVLASHLYDVDDYVSDYKEFEALVSK
jgi:UDP-2-acetamido-3-amino-2,3-dideoxy-glucuronate N-acetyltransferase